MPTAATLKAIKESDQDFEWYPTTDAMIEIVATRIKQKAASRHNVTTSVLDIGAGDGRVLTAIADVFKDRPALYAIEKSPILMQQQPEEITPLGTDLHAQNLTCLPVSVIFCNPPYSEFEQWVTTIIVSGHAETAYLVIPQRWEDSTAIAAAIKSRGAEAEVLYRGDFLDAERKARAKINIVEVRFPVTRGYHHNEVQDPFDVWFDQNIDTFDRPEDVAEIEHGTSLAVLRKLKTLADLVEAYDAEYAMMEENYRAIFRLDYALLKELGVTKEHVRGGIKKKMQGLKHKYWNLLFEKLDTVTNRLSTATKKRFLDRINGRTSIAFTNSNAYAVVLWAVKHANRYFDEQVIKLFRDLSTFDGAEKYKSNTQTWVENRWRYREDDSSHFKLDYRVVLSDGWRAIRKDDDGTWDFPGDLFTTKHELIDDIRAVLYNLGFATVTETEDDINSLASRNRKWSRGRWEDFYNPKGAVLYQIKAYQNGNVHLRFKPAAIKSLNIEAGRLLGWLQSPADVVKELGYTQQDAERYWNSTAQLGAGQVKFLTSGSSE